MAQNEGTMDGPQYWRSEIGGYDTCSPPCGDSGYFFIKFILFDLTYTSMRCIDRSFGLEAGGQVIGDDGILARSL
jgi:hypothetical protein